MYNVFTSEISRDKSSVICSDFTVKSRIENSTECILYILFDKKCIVVYIGTLLLH
jgi:hypothetical protein